LDGATAGAQGFQILFSSLQRSIQLFQEQVPCHVGKGAA
jgi:hypothetical protein